jgi:hypothetical protein
MSDRALFILGDKLNRDHYNLDTQTLTAPMDADSYPLKLDRDTVSKWLLRVKSWNITGSFALAGSVDGGVAGAALSGAYDLTAPSICNHVSGSILTGPFVSSRERDLIPLLNRGASIAASVHNTSFPIGGTSYSNSSPVFFGGIGSGTMSVTLSCFGGTSPPFELVNGGIEVDVSVGFPVGWNDSQGPAPKLLVTLVMLVEIDRSGVRSTDRLFRVTASSAVSSLPDSEPDSFIDGLTLPMKSYTDSLSPGATVDSHTISPVTITPSEFWPYKNRLGQAVFDTSSGAQLRDPFV